MSSDSNKEGANKIVEATQTKEAAASTDLDKNPIKFKTWDGQLTTEAHDKNYMEIALRSGNHSDLVKRILRQRIEARAKDFPRWPADVAAGARSIWVESRFWYDRERLSPDFDEDWRTYRAKYLHSLELDPREPVRVPEYETELINPIRRLYMKPGDWLQEKVLSKFARDREYASLYRITITRGIMIWMAGIGLYYWLKYNSMNWMERFRPRHAVSRPVISSTHPKYPFKDYRTEPAHHADYGFSRRTIFKDLRDYEDMSVVL